MAIPPTKTTELALTYLVNLYLEKASHERPQTVTGGKYNAKIRGGSFGALWSQSFRARATGLVRQEPVIRAHDLNAQPVG